MDSDFLSLRIDTTVAESLPTPGAGTGRPPLVPANGAGIPPCTDCYYRAYCKQMGSECQSFVSWSGNGKVNPKHSKRPFIQPTREPVMAKPPKPTKPTHTEGPTWEQRFLADAERLAGTSRPATSSAGGITLPSRRPQVAAKAKRALKPPM